GARARRSVETTSRYSRGESVRLTCRYTPQTVVKRLRLPPSNIRISGFRPELRILDYLATKKGDAERGPMLWISPADAKIRLLQQGELAWVYGPRRHELAVVQIDDSVPEGSVKLPAIAGVSVSARLVVTKSALGSPRWRARSPN